MARVGDTTTRESTAGSGVRTMVQVANAESKHAMTPTCAVTREVGCGVGDTATTKEATRPVSGRRTKGCSASGEKADAERGR